MAYTDTNFGMPFDFFNLMSGRGGGMGGFGALASLLKGPAGIGLAAFGLPLLGTMLGGGRREQDAFKKWEAQRNQLMSPQFLHNRMGEYLPMMQQLSQGSRAGILTGANAFQNTLSRNLASSGANRSGIGALASTAASSMASNQLLDLDSDIRRGSMGMAMNDRNTMMQLLSQGPQYVENPWLDSLGRGTNSFMAYLMSRNLGGGTRGY